MPETFDFSKLPQLSPRNDSWEKVKTRLTEQNQRKVLHFPKFSAFTAMAASLFLMSGAFLLELHSSGQIKPVTEMIFDDEVFSWYSELGSEKVNDDFDEFLTIYLEE
ncbi:MAG: hypothetical protein LBR60_06780 [Fibrobacter sp.]|nr:hypothetical protein [Fibrobacter sp.]